LHYKKDFRLNQQQKESTMADVTTNTTTNKTTKLPLKVVVEAATIDTTTGQVTLSNQVDPVHLVAQLISEVQTANAKAKTLEEKVKALEDAAAQVVTEKL
jgi:outer membrane murein-binding lipoprotein Lpp